MKIAISVSFRCSWSLLLCSQHEIEPGPRLSQKSNRHMRCGSASSCRFFGRLRHAGAASVCPIRPRLNLIELLVAGTPCGFLLGFTDPSYCCTYSIEALFLLSPPDFCLALSANVHGTGPVWRISRITSRARSSCASPCHLNRSGPVSVDADVQLEELSRHIHLPGRWDQCRCFTTASLSLGEAVDPDEPPPSPGEPFTCTSKDSRSGFFLKLVPCSPQLLDQNRDSKEPSPSSAVSGWLYLVFFHNRDIDDHANAVASQLGTETIFGIHDAVVCTTGVFAALSIVFA